MRNIFYFHTLDLSFKSAQTIQIIKDYAFLSKLGYKIHLYGKIRNKKELENIYNFLSEFSNVKIYLSRFEFLTKILFSNNFIVATRHLNKLKKVLFLKKIKKIKIVHEMHEESFTYLFKKNISKNKFVNQIEKTDLLIFTNLSQVEFFQNEFNRKPKTLYTVLPNGVEIEKMKNVKLSINNNYKILTYTGQFNKWKNVEIIFAALSLLPENFKLKVAGGQKEKDKNYISKMSEKYSVSNRIEYAGFISNHKIPDFLNNSDVLLVPLGDNIQSKYLTSPMKLIEYLATQIPIVTLDYSSVKSLKCSEYVYKSENNPQKFAENILKAVNDKNSENIIKRVECVEDMSYKNRSKKLDIILKRICNEF